MAKNEKPYPWGIKTFDDLDNWQIIYLSYANLHDLKMNRKERKSFIDYLGSYWDSKRATEEIKSDEDTSFKKAHTNVNFDKEKIPIVRMSREKQEKFELAMKEKFGNMSKLFETENLNDDFDIINVGKHHG